MHTDNVLTLMKQAGVSLKLSKCQFFQSKVDYLGHIVAQEKLSVASERTRAISDASFPKNLKQMRAFLRACNVYRRFVRTWPS